MARLRPDDSSRSLRALWLGPPGRRWPFDATYVAWATGTIAAFVFVPLWLGVGFVVGGFGFAVPFGFGFGIATAAVTARTVTRLVDYDRPLRYWRADIRAVLADRRAPARTAVRLRSRIRRRVPSTTPLLVPPPLPPKD